MKTRQASSFVLGVLLVLALASSLEGQTPSVSARGRWMVVHRPAAAQPPVAVGAPGSVSGDTFSFHHLLGFISGMTAQCLAVHLSGILDNTVTFDGVPELLDSYANGTQPAVFESEVTNPPSSDVEIDTIATSNTDDLFPEGFEDPETGTPLTAACIEIGIDDTLDSDEPILVDSASLDFLDDNSSLFGPIDITSAFSDPWDGRLSIVFPGLAGLGIDELRLVLETKDKTIFADGFETGNTSSWTDQVPD